MASLTEALGVARDRIAEAGTKAGRAFPDAFRGEEGRIKVAAERVEKDAARATAKLEAKAAADAAMEKAARGLDLAKKQAGVVEKAAAGRGFFGSIGAGIGGFFKGTFKVGWHVANRPITWGVQLGSKGIEKAGNAFAHSPRTAWLATGAVAAVGVGHVMNKRSERAAMDNINQLEMAQQAPMAQANAYRVTPEEAATLDARLKQGGQQGGFAANVEASRAAASSTPAV